MTRPRSFEDILSRLPGARQIGDEWTASCPAPGHKTPAGHLTLKHAGDKALVTCQGGRHSYADICQALGLDSLAYGSNGSKPASESRVVATYTYTDEVGKPLLRVLRYEPKDFRQQRPDGNGGWLWGVTDQKTKKLLVRLVPYRLPAVEQAKKEGQVVFKVAGEKDADNLAAIGLTATTNPMGEKKGKWKPEFTETLKGAHVVVIADKDDTGRRHAQEVASSLYGKARSLKVLELPDRDGLQVKDASDWLAAGGTRAELERLTAGSPEYKPAQSSQEETTSVVCMADVEPEAVEWLWHPFIPQGKLTLLEGDPGVGKSWANLAIATAISLGKGLPGAETTEPGRVLLASAEDGLGDTIRPRLDAMGADVSKIFAIKEALTLDETGFTTLEIYLSRVRPALLIIDPLVAYLGAGVDIHRANETRAVMSQLARLAEKFDVAILAVRHLTKGGMSKAIYRGLGSIDFTAACRSVLLAGNDPDNPQKRGLVHIKSNLAPAGPAIGYELRDDSFYWTGESDLTASRILAADNGAGTSELDEATTFLKGELAKGPVPAKDIYQAAQNTGIARRTLERAKATLQVKSKKKGDTWFWHLPESTSPTPPIQDLGELENIEARKEGMTEVLGDVDSKVTKVTGLNTEEKTSLPTIPDILEV